MCDYTMFISFSHSIHIFFSAIIELISIIGKVILGQLTPIVDSAHTTSSICGTIVGFFVL